MEPIAFTVRSATRELQCSFDAFRIDLSGMGLEVPPPELARCGKLLQLNLSGNDLHSLCGANGEILLPPQLKELDVSRNSLQRLDGLPEGLEWLTADGNVLEDLRGVSRLWKLRRLRVAGNPLRTLLADGKPVLPLQLKELDVSGPFCGDPDLPRLASLEGLPPRLLTLHINRQRLTTLEGLPQGLQRLYARFNYLDSLQSLPDSLRVLDVGANFLQQLDSVPPLLQTLSIHNNYLTTLPPLPNSLQELNVISNCLEELDLSANTNLERVWADLNRLSAALVANCGKLQLLSVEHNQIADITALRWHSAAGDAPIDPTKLRILGNPVVSQETLARRLQEIEASRQPTARDA